MSKRIAKFLFALIIVLQIPLVQLKNELGLVDRILMSFMVPAISAVCIVYLVNYIGKVKKEVDKK